MTAPAAHNTLVFQPAKTTDLPKIFELAKVIWHQHFPSMISSEQIEYMLENYCSIERMKEQIATEQYQFYLVKAASRHIGYLAFRPEPENNKLFISKLYLLADYRGHGYGRQMLQFSVDYARTQELPQIYLTVNKQNKLAIKAYKRFGFTITDAIVNEIGEGYVMDDFVMTLLL